MTCGSAVSLDVWVSGDHCSSVSPPPEGAHSGYRCPLSDEHRLVLAGVAEASSRQISMLWSAGTGASVVRQRLDAVAPLAGPDGVVVEGSWTRTRTATVRCTAPAARTVTLTATAGTGEDAVSHVSVVSVGCAVQGSITGLDDTSGSGTGTVTVSDGFTVTPAAAQCMPTASVGTAGVAGGAGGQRTASVRIDAVAGSEVSAVVSVDCTPPGHAPVRASATFVAVYADGCDSPLGVLGDGVTERSGTIATSTRCRSPQRWTDGGTATAYYARRHSFELTNPATVTIDLESASSNSRRLDTYVLLQQGRRQDGTGAVLARNDDRAPGDYDSRVSNSKLAPGVYTIEATTYGSYRTGSYDLTVTVQLEVLISGLSGSTRVGTGTATDHFTVVPADASCIPTSGTVTEGDDGQRTLSADLTALGDTDVTVECSYTGYTDSSATSTLTALAAVSDVEVRADSGGTCSEFSGTLDAGVDQEYVCTMTRGDTLAVTADATGPSARLSLGWTAATGVAAVGGTQSFGAAVDAGSVRFTHTATAGITCTASADVTLTVSRDSTVEHTTVLSITCVPPRGDHELCAGRPRRGGGYVGQLRRRSCDCGLLCFECVGHYGCAVCGRQRHEPHRERVHDRYRPARHRDRMPKHRLCDRCRVCGVRGASRVGVCFPVGNARARHPHCVGHLEHHELCHREPRSRLVGHVLCASAHVHARHLRVGQHRRGSHRDGHERARHLCGAARRTRIRRPGRGAATTTAAPATTPDCRQCSSRRADTRSRPPPPLRKPPAATGSSWGPISRLSQTTCPPL